MTHDMKQLAEVLKGWLLVCEASMPSHTSKFSPQKFTIPQLRVLDWLHFFTTTPICQRKDVKQVLECAGLYPPCMQALGPMSYRAIIKLLRENEELRVALKLRQIPNYSTLCHFERRQRKRKK